MTNSIILQFEGKNNPARAWELWFGAVNFASVSGLTFGNNYAILIINSSVPWLYGLPASAQRGIRLGFADISRSMPYPFGETSGINSEPYSSARPFVIGRFGTRGFLAEMNRRSIVDACLPPIELSTMDYLVGRMSRKICPSVIGVELLALLQPLPKDGHQLGRRLPDGALTPQTLERRTRR